MRSERRGCLRGLLAAAVAVVGLTLSAPGVTPSAHAVDACNAESLTQAEQAELPYVFVGTVTDVAESAKDGVVTRIYTVKVARWWAGDLPEQVRVVSPASASDCGLRGVRKGSPYLFQGSTSQEGQVVALSNEGTRKVGPRTVRQVTMRMGVKPQEPVAESQESDETEISATVLDDSEAPRVIDSVTVPAVVVLAGVLVFGLGAFLGRRHR